MFLAHIELVALLADVSKLSRDQTAATTSKHSRRRIVEASIDEGAKVPGWRRDVVPSCLSSPGVEL